MKAFKVPLILLFTGLLLFSVLSYFSAVNESYQKYADGEYCLRFHACTSGGSGGVPEGETDPDQLKTLLLMSDGVEVYVSDPHDGLCTVYFRNVTIGDYPVSRLTIDPDDLDYFYGREVYAKDDYILILSQLSDDDIEAGAVNSAEAKNPAFRGYETEIFFMVSLFGVILLYILLICKMDIGLYIDAVFLGIVNIVWAVIVYS